MKKKTIVSVMCIIMALSTLLTACSPKEETRIYKDGMFSDVEANSPYRSYIAAVYEMGLMTGRGDEGVFGVDEYLSVGEGIAVADRLHNLYMSGKEKFEQSDPWYKVYADYALENGIISEEPADYNAYMLRSEFSTLLAATMPAEALPAINTVVDNAIMDVNMQEDYAAGVYLLYRAGIFTGDKEDGSFKPDEKITKADVAMALARMAASNMRGRVSLTEPYKKPFSPDLTARPAANDDFFKNAAIIGNSLVEGLKMYSNLTTATYYSGTSMSVVSAMSKEIPLLEGKTHDKVYIELGINEIGNSVDTFKKNYGEMIDAIREYLPDAELYIMSILPVSQAKSGEGYFTIDRVKAYNSALYELAEEKECYYLDVYSALVGSDGYLPADETWDGVHLSPDTYGIWENCIREYYAVEEK